jgi:hypothetical protein
MGGGRPDLVDQRGLVAGIPYEHLATATTRGAPADVTGFEEHDPITPFRQVQCGRTARDAATDYANVSRDIAGKWDVLRCLGHDGRVIRRGITLAIET